MIASKISEKSSVYHYTLIKRVHHSPAYQAVSSACAGAFVCGLALFDRLSHMWHLLPALGTVLAVHTCIFLIFCRMSEIGRREQGWLFSFFWVGLLPKRYFPVTPFWKAHVHLFFAGTALMLLALPWSSVSFGASLLFFHFWMLLPRMWIVYLLKKKSPEGWIKISGQHTSLYRS